MRRRLLIACVAGTALLAAGVRLHPVVLGLSLVVRAANLQGTARGVADLTTVAIDERTFLIPDDDGPIQARAYVPTHTSRETVMLVSGVHPAGFDEPRLVMLARELAESGVTVVTPDIPDLREFEITSAITDRIEHAARWLSDSPLTPSARIGIIGVSFSGGLSVVAAARPSLRNRLSWVMSIGGHDDLPRVLRFFCGDNGGEGASVPHDYGVAIVLLVVAPDLVPADQVASLREGVRQFLSASYVDRFDKAAAQREFQCIRHRASTLPEPSRSALRYVVDRDVASLGSILRPHFDAYADAPALSPARSPAPDIPVFLLHGRYDNVIPAWESEQMYARLKQTGRARMLITDLLSHADADRPPLLVDIMRLADFWGDVLTR